MSSDNFAYFSKRGLGRGRGARACSNDIKNAWSSVVILVPFPKGLRCVLCRGRGARASSNDSKNAWSSVVILVPYPKGLRCVLCRVGGLGGGGEQVPTTVRMRDLLHRYSCSISKRFAVCTLQGEGGRASSNYSKNAWSSVVILVPYPNGLRCVLCRGREAEQFPMTEKCVIFCSYSGSLPKRFAVCTLQGEGEGGPSKLQRQ